MSRPAPAPARRRRSNPASRGVAIAFLAPAIVVLCVVFLVPIAQAASYSFTDWGGGVHAGRFIGLDNFREAIGDERVQSAFEHNALLLLVVPVEVVIAIFIASVLRERIIGHTIYRYLVFVPLMISITIIGYMWQFMLSPTGLVVWVLSHTGFDTSTWESPLASETWALPSIAGLLIWRDTGFAVLLFYSRLLSIDGEIYEAAELDGVSRLRRMRSIEAPLLRNPITIYTVLMTIWLFSFVFNYIFVTTGGGPGYATTVAEYEVYHNAFDIHRFGYASAIAILLLLITLPVVAIQIRLQLRGRRT